ncbi:hypothetical protein P167DRAFT_129919 [Morchella conica CCBAS932]|uniref:Uncharacterized protein n=1 Tax=Morchella conica CCBAS932 TaxID=1392247 RepID=A0A3N4L3J4_9PEZI|nr:hypothetical protein P167DRAFT_129919 [Morchella conica CCBAS932]
MRVGWIIGLTGYFLGLGLFSFGSLRDMRIPVFVHVIIRKYMNMNNVHFPVALYCIT